MWIIAQLLLIRLFLLMFDNVHSLMGLLYTCTLLHFHVLRSMAFVEHVVNRVLVECNLYGWVFTGFVTHEYR